MNKKEAKNILDGLNDDAEIHIVDVSNVTPNNCNKILKDFSNVLLTYIKWKRI